MAERHVRRVNLSCLSYRAQAGAGVVREVPAARQASGAEEAGSGVDRAR
jgi:hypothetical protein